MAHSQVIGEVEVTNRVILQGIKKRLGKARSWTNELHHVLWAYRTMPRVPTGEIPFNLAFGVEAMILVELGVLLAQIVNFDKKTNSERRLADLDLLDEV